MTEQRKDEVEKSGGTYFPTFCNGKCSLLPDSCGRFMTQSALLKVEGIEVIPVQTEEETEETVTSKPQAKAAPKKKKVRIEQVSMFE